MESRQYPQAESTRVETLADLEKLVSTLRRSTKPVAVDIETGYHGKFRDKGALDPQRAFIVGLSMTDSSSWSRYVPLRHGLEYPDPENLPWDESWAIIKPLLETHPRLIIHNLRFELAFFERVGIHIPVENVIDTMLLSYAAGIRPRHGLKYLTNNVLNADQQELVDLFMRPDPMTGKVPRRTRDIRFNALSPTDPDVIRYACEDTSMCVALYEKLSSEVRPEQQGILGLENRVVGVVLDMERRGLAVDWDAMHRAKVAGTLFLTELEAELRAHMSAAVGRDCSTLNFNSTPQMRQFIYGSKEDGGLGLPVGRRTDTGQPSTDALTLKQFEDEVPVFGEYRNYKEAENTLRKIDSWIEDFSEAPDGKIHPSYMQTSVASGRFSANNPNIQQVQKAWEFATADGSAKWEGNFRAFIVASPGHYFLTYDVSQIELRMLAGISGEPSLLEAFVKGIDVHTATASAMLGKPVAEVTKDDRSQGKCLTGDTLVRTPDGLVRLDSLGTERRPEHVVPMLDSGVQVWDGTSFRDVLAFYSDGSRPVWRIRTTRGYEVMATADHPWWTPSGWVKTSEVVPDSTWIAVSLNGAAAGPTATVEPSRHDGVSGPSVTIKVTPAWACVLALVDYARWTDGFTVERDGSAMLRLPSVAEVVVDRIKADFQTIGLPCRIVRTTVGTIDLVVPAALFPRSVVELRGGSDAVSAAVLRSPAPVQAAYLRMLLDALGQVGPDEVQILLPDAPAAQVQLLLAGLGVRCQVRQAVKSAVSSAYRGLDDEDPSGWSRLGVDDDRDLTRLWGQVGSMWMTNLVDESASDFSTPLYGDWDQVVDVEYLGHRPVFDLTVDRSSRFEANGLIGSNTLNFALLYGMGPYEMAERLKIATSEAKELRNKYFSSFTRIRRWVDEVRRAGVKNDSVQTVFGRRVPIFEYESGDNKIRAKGDRLAVNATVQGSAADVMKIAMVQVKKALEDKGWWNTKVFMVMNLHDALTFEVSDDIDPSELRELLAPVVELHFLRTDRRKFGCNVIDMTRFPTIEVEWELGQSWGRSTAWPKDAPAVFVDGRWQVADDPEKEVGDDDGAGPEVAEKSVDDGPLAGRLGPMEIPLPLSTNGGSHVQGHVPDRATGSVNGHRAGAGLVRSAVASPGEFPHPVLSPEGHTASLAVAEAPSMAQPLSVEVFGPTGEDPVSTVELVLPEPLTEALRDGLKALIAKTPGPQPLVLILGDQRKPVPAGSSLTEADLLLVEAHVPGATMRRVGFDAAMVEGVFL